MPFANNVYAMYAILGRNNEWTIAETREVNARFRAQGSTASSRALAAPDEGAWSSSTGRATRG